ARDRRRRRPRDGRGGMTVRGRHIGGPAMYQGHAGAPQFRRPHGPQTSRSGGRHMFWIIGLNTEPVMNESNTADRDRLTANPAMAGQLTRVLYQYQLADVQAALTG